MRSPKAAEEARRLARQIAELQSAEADRIHAIAAFDGSADGRFVPARPMDHTGGGSAASWPAAPVNTQIVLPPQSGWLSAAIGASVRLRFSQTGPGVVSFTDISSEIAHTGWVEDFTGGLPLSALPAPWDAYYSIHLDADVAPAAQGQSWFLIDGERRTRDYGWGSQTQREWKSGPLNAGQTMGVELDVPAGVTVTGQVSFHLVEPWRRLDEVECPSPWAWHRDDDLAGTAGTTVTAWTDRSGNGRHLDDSGAFAQPVVAAGGGITSAPAEARGGLQAEYPAVEFSTITVTVVMDGAVNDYDPFSAGDGALGQSSTAQLLWYPGFAYIGAYVGTAYAENNTEVAATGLVAVTFVRTGAGVVRMWINGTEYTAWDATLDDTDPFSLAWHQLTVEDGSTRELLIVAQDVGMDGCVDLPGVGQTTLRDYLTSQYPTLFGGA